MRSRRARVFFAVCRRVPFGCERGGACKHALCIAPRGHIPERDTLDPGQLVDAPHRLLVELHVARRTDTEPRHRQVEHQYLPHLVSGIRGLQRDQRSQQHARAGEQHERERDLSRCKHPQSPIGAGRDSEAAVGEAKSGRPAFANAAGSAMATKGRRRMPVMAAGGRRPAAPMRRWRGRRRPTAGWCRPSPRAREPRIATHTARPPTPSGGPPTHPERRRRRRAPCFRPGVSAAAQHYSHQAQPARRAHLRA